MTMMTKNKFLIENNGLFLTIFSFPMKSRIVFNVLPAFFTTKLNVPALFVSTKNPLIYLSLKNI